MSAIEEIQGQIAELTNQVKDLVTNHGGVSGWNAAEAEAKLTELLEAQKAAILDAMPARAGEFQSTPVQRAVAGYSGKYATELGNIAARGEHKEGNWRLRGSDLVLAKILLDRANLMKGQGVAFQGADKLRPASSDLANAVKALTSTGSATGDELVPTGMAGELWQDFFTASQIVSDLPSQPMPTDPFDMPLGLGDVTWRKGGQGASPSATNVATAKSTLTSTEQVAEVDWTYNLEEDAVVAMMPALRQRLTISGGEQMDAFVINADATATSTGNINSDDGTPASDSYYLSDGQDGIRHLSIVDNTSQANSGGGDALADADLVALLNDLNKYGTQINECRIVPGIQSYFAMLGLTNVATFDKYGQFATIVRGELARYRGVPVIPSASVLKSESDYKQSVTAGNNSLGQILAYNRNYWRVGFRRGLLIEVDRNIQTRQLIMVVSFRVAVACHGTRSSAQHTALLGNFTV